MIDFFEGLGVEKKINAATTYTAIGGSLMDDEVLDAMRSAAGYFIDMRELQIKAGEKIAKLTRNEAAFITSGCASAIVLSILGLRTNGDAVEIGKVISGTARESEVIIQNGHRINYDAAIKLAGSKIVTVGNAIETHAWQIESAITEFTTAIFFVPGSHLAGSTLSLNQIVQIAHARGIPVIVDAAAQLPPVSNFWEFTENLGADLVLFSGGKAIRGPQASGLILGKAKHIESISANASPNALFARALKVGKEEIAGLTTAIERFINLDHDAELLSWNSVVDFWFEGLMGQSQLTIEKESHNEAGQPVPRLRLSPSDGNAMKLVAQLKKNSPSIEVVHNSSNNLWLSPDSLKIGEAAKVLQAILKFVKLS